MAPSPIPEGFGIAVGRGPERARQALDAAVAAGFEETVVQTRSNGYLVPLKALDIIENQDKETAERSAAADAETDQVEEPAPDVPVPADQPADPDAPETPAADEAPAKNAKTEDWVAYAQTKGYDEAEGLNRDALIERYGA